MNIFYRNTGLSLIELMIAIVIGSMLMLGLITTFKTSSDSYRALQKSSDMIENGRYAMDVLYNDIRHAGYYGHFNDLGTFPAALPDPCETASETNLLSALAAPVQGYANVTAATFTPTTCDTKGFFTAADLRPNSDVLIIRRAETDLFAGTNPAATAIEPVGATAADRTTTDGEVYLQTNTREAEVQIAVNAVEVDPLDLTASAKTAKNTTPTLEKMPGKTIATWADTRKLRVHIYYLSQCNAAAVCTSADTPTLKRLELGHDGSGGTTMNIVPLVEGIEYFKLQYGLDTSPATVNVTTGSIGDGIPDSYVTIPASVADYENIVSIKASILVRALEETQGYADNKAYTVGPLAVAATGDRYKRSVYTTEIRPNNIAGRREIP